METIEFLAQSIGREKKTNYDELYERLLFSLSMLKQFFRAGGQGLSTEALEFELYQVNALCVQCELPLIQCTYTVRLGQLSRLARYSLRFQCFV